MLIEAALGPDPRTYGQVQGFYVTQLRRKTSRCFATSFALVLSLFACIPSGWTFNFFNFECVLYADLSVTVKDNNTVVLDWSKSTWGKPIQCHMATYAPVVAAIHAFIWIWFYFQMEELDGKIQSLPALLFGCILHSCICLALLVSSGMLTGGINALCKNLQNRLPMYRCSELEDMQWTTLKGTEEFYSYMKVTEICTWFSAITSAVLAVLNGYRARSIISALSRKDGSETGSVLLRRGKEFGSSHFFLEDSFSIRSNQFDRTSQIV